MNEHNEYIFNGLRYDAETRELVFGAPPTAEELQRHADAVDALAARQIAADNASDPSSRFFKEACDRISPTLYFTFNQAAAEPWPLWLLIHLYRNGCSAVDVVFLFESGQELELESRLKDFIACKRNLNLATSPDPQKLLRLLRMMDRDVAFDRIGTEAASGALPARFCVLSGLYKKRRVVIHPHNLRQIRRASW
jgi:hypothetical protein